MKTCYQHYKIMERISKEVQAKEQRLDNAHDEETRKDLPSGLVPREEAKEETPISQSIKRLTDAGLELSSGSAFKSGTRQKLYNEVLILRDQLTHEKRASDMMVLDLTCLRDQLAAKEKTDLLMGGLTDAAVARKLLEAKDKELAELRQQSESQVKEIAELKEQLKQLKEALTSLMVLAEAGKMHYRQNPAFDWVKEREISQIAIDKARKLL